MLKQSAFLQIIPNGNVFIAYHALFGQPLFLNQEAYDFLRTFSNWREDNFATIEEKKTASEFLDLYFIVSEETDELALLESKCQEYSRVVASGSQVRYLSLIMAETCNFGCNYCFAEAFNEARMEESCQPLMGAGIANCAIDQFMALANSHNQPDVYINFGGGEPLLNFRTIVKAVEYIESKYTKIPVKFGINTNASLITDEIALFLKLHNFEIATSLDGPQKWNDKVRTYRGSKKETYGAIQRGFAQLKRAGNIVDGFSVTITPQNLPGINKRFIKWLANQGYTDIRLDLDAIHCYSEINPEKVALKLIALKRYGRELGMYISGFWERSLENMYPPILESHTSFCGGKRGNSMCVAPNGNIYLCGYSGQKVGSVINDPLPNKTYTDLVCAQFAGLHRQCNGCPIEGQCIGGCLIAEEISSAEKSSIMDFNCRLYRAATVQLLKDQSVIIDD